ncbi:related to sorbitol utilization protein sou1 [Fusarium fujikuroi]|nr:related to sorbitol utilization protein sou1 [Fusarium fujikuroi]
MEINTDGLSTAPPPLGDIFEDRSKREQRSTVLSSKISRAVALSPQLACLDTSSTFLGVKPFTTRPRPLSFTCSLAIEWHGFARVNSVSPGFINTGIFGPIAEEIMSAIMDKVPMGRFGETVELKGVYLFLASDASTYVTGTDILVDGGYTAP